MIKLFVDALDKAVRSGRTEVLINDFPIDIELTLGADFSKRTTYTGICNISGVEFDMSFRVQCSENYYGPNCTVAHFVHLWRECMLVAVKGELSASTVVKIIMSTSCTTCVPHYDPSTNCTQCLTGRDASTNCTTCLPGYDPSTDCTQCLTGRDMSTTCNTCLLGYGPSTDCIQCLTGRDASTYCSQCLTNRDIRTKCTTCLPGYDPQTNCTHNVSLTFNVSCRKLL